jgi:hypothetical protein
MIHYFLNGIVKERRINMVIMSLTSYPTESADQVGKRFLELPTLPEYINMIGPYINTVVGEGIKGITIYEFEESKYPEASKFLHDRAAKMLGIPGFTYSLEPWLEAQDALSLIGLA